MGCSASKEGGGGAKGCKARTPQEALAFITSKHAEINGCTDKFAEIEEQVKAQEGEDYTATKDVEELREFALVVTKKFNLGDKKQALEQIVDPLFPDPVGDMQMKTTRIPEFDEVFDKASSPIATLIDLRKDLFEGSSNMKAACGFGGQCKSVKQAMENVKREAGGAANIKPELKSDGSVKFAGQSTGPISDALESISTFAEKCVAVVGTAPKLTEELQEVAGAASEFPSKAQSAGSNAGLSFTETIAAVKNSAVNSKGLSALPAVCTQTSSQATKSLADIKEGVEVLKA